MKKIIAKKGKLLYCKELNRYVTATTDDKHEWIEIDENEVNENGERE